MALKYEVVFRFKLFYLLLQYFKNQPHFYFVIIIKLITPIYQKEKEN